ncbi:MAG: YicC family protein [Planctomycetes bacterium RBG_13_63_9]|nr:MAG: YicC family protein [Planctomycetes bacterium RBG_13_63_9]
MLLSMTGFGEAHHQQDELDVVVEVRTINSRYLKVSVRAPEGYASLEPQIEAIVRRTIRRGTIQVNVRTDRLRSAEDFRINADVLDRYRLQLQSFCREWDLPQPVSLENLLLLPGVVDEEASGSVDATADWPPIRSALEAAMENLARMRTEEGKTMAADLKTNCRAAATSLENIRQRAPLVVDAYRGRLEERLKRTLAEYDVVLDPADLIKEISVFAERGDVSEEIVRMQSHLDQFDAIMDLPESSGKKLEFLAQEMFRETNTIGAKASDVEIAREVIEIKAAIERIREMVQNVE